MITEKCYVDVLMTTCRRIFSIRQLFFKMLTNPKQSIWTSLEYPGFWWKKRLDAARDIAFWKVVDSTRFHQIPPDSTVVHSDPSFPSAFCRRTGFKQRDVTDG